MDGTEIWWGDDCFANVRFKATGFKVLTFDPPFDVDTDRLRLLMVFS